MENLNLSCPINNLSYGLASLNIVKHLSKQRKISLFPIGGVQLENKGDGPLIQELVNNQDEVNPDATSLRIYHQFDLVTRIGHGHHIGWPIFELNEFTKREVINLKSCDELIVCSKWAAEVLSESLELSSNVVPLGVDRSIFHEYQSSWDSPYTFICVGKIEYRKGHDLLPHLFAKALPKGGDWQLRMLWGNPFLRSEEKHHWESYYKSILGDNVSFSDRVATQQDVANEMRAADAGISISRAEGWDLPLLELMSCGKPVIATDYSAHAEFCSSANSLLVDITELETANDGKWFHGQGEWAKLGHDQQDQIISHINTLYKGGKGVINEEGIETAKKFSWENTVNKLLSIV